MAHLRTFLDSVTLHDDCRRYTVREIRHCYLTWKREGVLRHFGPLHLSSLISLLGSISMTSPGRCTSSLHTHRRVSDIPAADREPHWDLVLTICLDKQGMQYPLSKADVYWLMRAHISRFWEHADSDEPEAQRCLVAAKQCYDKIWDTSQHPDMHLPYFQVLLADPSTEHLHLYATHMAGILTQNGRLHPSLRDQFFRTIVSRAEIASYSRRTILSAISQRIDARELQDGSSEPADKAHDGDEGRYLRVAAPRLVAALEHALLDHKSFRQSSVEAHSDISRWANAIAHCVFSISRDEDRTIDLRWNCLVLLALVRTRSSQWNGASAETWSDPIVRGAVMEWQTVCVLAAIENVLGPALASGSGALPSEVVQGFCGVLRGLWNDWTSISPSAAPPRPLLVSRLICASFFQLAGWLGDRVLVDTCREYCVSAGLWAINESEPSPSAGLQALATEQLYAALKCDTFFERALVDLVVCTTDMEILRGAVDAAVMRYARSDPEQAQELLAWASHRGIAPSGKAVARVGMALARHGINSYLDRYIDHPSLTAEQRAEVVVAYLRMFVEHGRRFMDPRAVVGICPKVVNLSTQVTHPRLLLDYLLSTLRVLIREGYGGQAVTLFEDLSKHSSSIPAAAISQFLRALLWHRRFSLARRILTSSAHTHPDMIPRWSRLVAVFSARGGARKLASALTFASAPKRPPPTTATTVPLTTPERWPGISTTSAQPRPLQVLQRLVNADRLHAAKKLYERICKEEEAEVRTAAGNMIILGAARRASRGQRVGAVAHIYRTLVEKYGFVPDRVTVNTLFSALLSGGEMDKLKARGLFNAVVQMGYPDGNIRQGEVDGDVQPRGPFFGAVPAIVPMLGDVEIPRLASPVMYMRHVRPLYKMFIKAFHGLGDAEAAWKVVGIIKALEAENARRVVDGQDWVVVGTKSNRDEP
ncbi:hypothetical protein OH77DRAFT_1394477 [Trametes cingulata]|nr:hypothetical protein OH77DRAFT_1394477 [Trametes cingulata]